MLSRYLRNSIEESSAAVICFSSWSAGSKVLQHSPTTTQRSGSGPLRKSKSSCFCLLGECCKMTPRHIVVSETSNPPDKQFILSSSVQV